jgi:hypothetical protein
MRRFSSLLIFALAAPLSAQQKPATTLQLPPKPLLPQSFAGWTAAVVPVEAMQPIEPEWRDDSADLTELGFRREATAQYAKGAEKLDVQAFQFQDATGAYGMFAASGEGTIRPHSDGHGDDIARFRNGDTVVIATTDGGTWPHLADDLQALAKTLPIPFGSKGEIPSLPNYLPKSGLDVESVRYALGSQGFAHTQSPLAGKLDFNTGAEVVVANYGPFGGSATLTLVEYPTPQMAAAQLKTIAASLQLAQQHDDLFTGANMAAERSGPIIALASGLPQAQAIKLAGQVHYEAEITWNHPEGYVSDAWRAAHLYLGIFALAGILCAASVILGLFFGGARALSRVLRGKSASAVEDTEFISLDLGTGGELRKLDAPPDPPKD